MSRAPWPAALISCLLLLTAACSTAADSVVSSTSGAESATRIPNTSPSSEASPQPEMTLDNPGISPTPPAVSPTETSAPTPQPATKPTATLPATKEPGLHIHCNGDMCSYASPYFLKRPIAEPGNDGVDVTYRWKPLRTALYRGLEVRGEYVTSDRELDGPTAESAGWYLSADYRLARRWWLGGRLESSDRADDDRLRDRGHQLLLTFAPSEYARFRAAWRHREYAEGPEADELLLQFQFVMGAHGAHPF